VPGSESQWLLNRLSTADLAQIELRGEDKIVTLCGISASTNGTAYALLRNWQSAARLRLSAGLQR
jgi:hypothetical protein